MTKLVILASFCCLLSVACGYSVYHHRGSYNGGQCCSSKSSNSNPSIDYVQLTVQSAAGFCALKNCNPPVSGWTIHGLWPSQKQVMGPNNCNGSSSFDASSMINNQRMQKEWPTLYGGDPTSFWCHEWCKHGTCAVAAGLPSINSPTAYFETALDLFEKLDIDNSLKRSGIDHSSSSTYELNQFFSVFSVKPTFECQKSGDGQILFQARFCYDTNMQPADCQMDWFASIESCDDNLPIYYN